MKICWDNLEGMKYNKKRGTFRAAWGMTFHFFESCLECGENFLGRYKNSVFCSHNCHHTSKKWKRNTGNKHSEETKKKMGEARIGIIFTGETKQKISKTRIKRGVAKGENNPMWKGGISCEPYCTQWSDVEYKRWLKYERDRGKCQNPCCSGKFTLLCLHHINYDKKDCRPVNLITVCMSCNGVANGDREWWEAWYNEIIRRKYI
ncbi:MAG: NUMOD3 domain-containing DNA-binding protein [Candidatus Shapirobacteria bacterium]